MSESNRFNGYSDWIDLKFVERERTPREIIEVGIQIHIDISLSSTKYFLEKLGVDRSRTAIHNWLQKTDVQPTIDTEPDHIAVDENVIQLNNQRHWLYAAVDPETNEFLHVRLFQTRSTERTMLFLRKMREKISIEQATFLVDDAHYLKRSSR